MVTSKLDNRQKSSNQDRLVSAALEFLALMPAQDQIRQQCEEGRAIDSRVDYDPYRGVLRALDSERQHKEDRQ